MTPEWTFLIVVVYSAAVLFAGAAVRVAVRWWHIRRRPVLTCAEFASATPGMKVMVVGRTAAGPILGTPISRMPCVAYQAISTHTHVVSDNYQETTRTVDSERGDTMLHGVNNARVVVDERVRKERLIGDRAMMFASPAVADHDNTKTDQRTKHEFIVLVDQAVVAAGVVASVDGGRKLFLDRGSWVDGSVQGTVDELTGLFVRRIVATLISALALVGLAILLTHLNVS